MNPVDGSEGQESEIQDQPQKQGFTSSKDKSQNPVNKPEHKRGSEGDKTSGDGDIVLKVNQFVSVSMHS